MSIKEELEDFEFGVCDWGSCQYAGAEHAYEVFMKHWQKNNRDTEKTIAEFNEALGCKIQRFAVEKASMPENFRTQLKEQIADYDEEDKYDWPKRIEMVVTPGDALKMCREMAWDLWSAAPFVASICGITIEEMPPAPGVGPEFNILAQNDNWQTGICCAVMIASGFTCGEEDFEGFDT